MRSFGHPTPAPPQLGRGRGTRARKSVLFVLLAAVAPLLTVACGRGRENAVIPGRFDLARQSRAVLPGKTYESREKIRQGLHQAELSAALGDPSEKLESRGQIVSGHWTYLYADGKIVIQLRDGMITEIETTFY